MGTEVTTWYAKFDNDFTPGIFETPHISKPQEETLMTILIILVLLDWGANLNKIKK